MHYEWLRQDILYAGRAQQPRAATLPRGGPAPAEQGKEEEEERLEKRRPCRSQQALPSSVTVCVR